MEYNVVLEKDREEVYVKYLLDEELYSTFEFCLFEFARDYLSGYRGGYWEMYTADSTFFMSPGRDSEVKKWKLKGKSSKEVFDRIDVGMMLTYLALQPTSLEAYIQNIGKEHVSKVQKGLEKLINRRENCENMWSAIP